MLNPIDKLFTGNLSETDRCFSIAQKVSQTLRNEKKKKKTDKQLIKFKIAFFESNGDRG